MTRFTLPPMEKFAAIVALSRSINRRFDLPDDINKQISSLLGLDDSCWDDLAGAFELREIVYAGYDYLNVDFREYYTGTPKGYYLVKLESPYGESEGDHFTRAGALLDAILSHIVFEMESA